MKTRLITFGMLVIASLLVASCAPATPPPPVTVMETVIVTAAPAPTEAPTAAPAMPTPVVSLDPSLVGQKGKLLICSDMPYPPMEFFDENGKPTGVDVEIGTEISNRLGLQVQFVNSVFDTIIAAVTSGKSFPRVFTSK